MSGRETPDLREYFLRLDVRLFESAIDVFRLDFVADNAETIRVRFFQSRSPEITPREFGPDMRIGQDGGDVEGAIGVFETLITEWRSKEALKVRRGMKLPR